MAVSLWSLLWTLYSKQDGRNVVCESVHVNLDKDHGVENSKQEFVLLIFYGKFTPFTCAYLHTVCNYSIYAKSSPGCIFRHVNAIAYYICKL